MSIDLIETGTFVRSSKGVGLPAKLRILSWNINRGLHLESIAEFLSAIQADIVLLQEVDQNTRRTGFRNVARELARVLSLNYVFGVEFQELAQGTAGSPALHGHATLSRWPLLNSRVLRFQSQSSFWRPRWWLPNLAPLQRRLGGRMALVSCIGCSDGGLTVYNLHLESRHNDNLRRLQLLEMIDDTKRYSANIPIIVAGDFNFDLRREPQALLLTDGGFNAADPDGSTVSAGRAKAIDFVLTRGTAAPHVGEVHHLIDASDHYPVSTLVGI
jgi:endonuclease/exonuclease/phosphatase family metal-dependent hydrolase